MSVESATVDYSTLNAETQLCEVCGAKLKELCVYYEDGIVVERCVMCENDYYFDVRF